MAMFSIVNRTDKEDVIDILAMNIGEDNEVFVYDLKDKQFKFLKLSDFKDMILKGYGDKGKEPIYEYVINNPKI